MKKIPMVKEQYFTNENIDQIAQAFLKELQPVVRRTEVNLNLKKTALCVIDMQNYFMQPTSHAFIPSAQAIIPKIKQLQTFFLKDGLCVIHTRHGNTPKDAYNMASWWGKLLDRHSSDAQIIEELTSDKALIVDKTQYDAFYQTRLNEILKERNISQLIITGVMTHLCAETTARSAFMQNFEVFFAVDGTATYRRGLHLASLLTLSHGFAVPVLMQTIEEQFKHGK